MRTITDELSDLKAILDLLCHEKLLDEFIGRDEVDSRLRWAAKSIADKIDRLARLEG